jgi:hypothetical protein
VFVSDDTKALSGLRAAGDKIAAVAGYMYGQGTGVWSGGVPWACPRLDGERSGSATWEAGRRSFERKDGHLGMVCCLSTETVLCTWTYVHTDEMEGPWMRTSPPGGASSLPAVLGGSPRSLRQLSSPPLLRRERARGEQSRITIVCIFPAVQRREVTRYVLRLGQGARSLGLSKAVLAFASWLAAARTSVSCTPESRCWRQRVDHPYGCAARAQFEGSQQLIRRDTAGICEPSSRPAVLFSDLSAG